MHMYLSAIMAGLLGICWVPHRAAYRYRFFDIDTDTDTTFRYRYQCDPYRDIHVPYYPEWGYFTLKSGELPSRAPHTTYCNCLCSNNVQWQLPQSLPGQCSHIKFLHFIGINRYFMVSRMIFYNIIVTFLSNTRCKYRFRVLFWVCHFDTLDRYRVISISDRVTICSPSATPFEMLCLLSLQWTLLLEPAAVPTFCIPAIYNSLHPVERWMHCS